MILSIGMPWDPKSMIQQAYDQSVSDGRVRYVTYNDAGTSFVISTAQPPPTKSHWKVHPDGELDAHVDASPLQKEYNYERVQQ